MVVTTPRYRGLSTHHPAGTPYVADAECPRYVAPRPFRMPVPVASARAQLFWRAGCCDAACRHPAPRCPAESARVQRPTTPRTCLILNEVRRPPQHDAQAYQPPGVPARSSCVVAVRAADERDSRVHIGARACLCPGRPWAAGGSAPPPVLGQLLMTPHVHWGAGPRPRHMRATSSATAARPRVRCAPRRAPCPLDCLRRACGAELLRCAAARRSQMARRRASGGAVCHQLRGRL